MICAAKHFVYACRNSCTHSSIQVSAYSLIHSLIPYCRYAVQKGAYDEYFSKLTGQYNNLWSAPEGENDTASFRVAAVAATAVILTPLVLVGAKIGMQWMR